MSLKYAIDDLKKLVLTCEQFYREDLALYVLKDILLNISPDNSLRVDGFELHENLLKSWWIHYSIFNRAAQNDELIRKVLRNIDSELLEQFSEIFLEEFNDETKAFRENGRKSLVVEGYFSVFLNKYFAEYWLQTNLILILAYQYALESDDVEKLGIWYCDYYLNKGEVKRYVI